MKYIGITFIFLVSVFAACELGWIQQFTHLFDAQVEEMMLKNVTDQKKIQWVPLP